MVWHNSAGQLRQLAADRDSEPPLAATSWSAPPPRTLAPVHLLWRAQRHGTSCQLPVLENMFEVLLALEEELTLDEFWMTMKDIVLDTANNVLGRKKKSPSVD